MRRSNRRRRKLIKQTKTYFCSAPHRLGRLVAAVAFACLVLIQLLFGRWKHALGLEPVQQATSPLVGKLDNTDCEDYGCPLYPLDIESVPFLNESRQVVPSNLLGHSFSATAATVTRRGNEGHPNQDRAFIIEPFLTRQTPRETKSFLMAILDGHGTHGHHVAQYLRTAIPQRLAQKLNSRPCCYEDDDDWIQQALNETFIEVDQEGSPNLLTGGSTASVTLRIGNKLFFANCGDSLTILVKRDVSIRADTDQANEEATSILHQTRRDKAHLPDERARIEAMGGTIFIPQQYPTQSRVIVYSVASIPHEPIGLAMSRSIGDWEWKLYGVTAEPIVNVVNLAEYTDDNHAALFIIAASDGVWDMRPRREFFAKRIGRALVAQTEPLWKTCVTLLWDASPENPKWYRDDMTLLVMKIS